MLTNGLLTFDRVSKVFGETTVLDDLSFELGGGRTAGLIGDNGVGKTTLMRLAAGILKPTSGVVGVAGHQSPADVRASIGALLEKPGHYDELTVAENLRYFFGFYGHSAADVRAAVSRTIEAHDLGAVANTRAGRLSSGFRQRLAVARALQPWARLVLLDEPFESLDPPARAGLKHLIRERRRDGALVIFSSHGLGDVHDLCDELLFLSAAGQLHRFETFEEMRRRWNVPETVDLDSIYTAVMASEREQARRIH